MIDIRTVNCRHWRDEYCESCNYEMAKYYNKIVAEIETMKETDLVKEVMANGLARPTMTLRQMREIYADYIFTHPMFESFCKEAGLQDKWLEKIDAKETDLDFDSWVKTEGMN